MRNKKIGLVYNKVSKNEILVLKLKACLVVLQRMVNKVGQWLMMGFVHQCYGK